jgi:NAD+-dependent secondary alcohol dehydrogenase Adh1
LKAVQLSEQGGSPSLDDVPEPTITGPWDVIVRIGGAGLCRTDIHIIEGQMALPLPLILGHENAGWVSEVGSAVFNVAVGDAVIMHPIMSCGFCRACRAGVDMLCSNYKFPGLTASGGMAEFLKTSARAVVPLPAGIAPADIAAHADAGLTAYHAIKKAVPALGPGTSVVVLGAGGLGHIGIQCLKAMTTARVIAVDPREMSLELATELGADHVVLSDGTQVEKVVEITNGGATAVLDFVGEGGAEQDAGAMLGQEGTHYVVGYGGTIEMPTGHLVNGEKRIAGCQVGTYLDLVDLVQLTVDGYVKLHNRMYPLDAYDEAIADMRAGRLLGRAVLVPQPETGTGFDDLS